MSAAQKPETIGAVVEALGETANRRAYCACGATFNQIKWGETWAPVQCDACTSIADADRQHREAAEKEKLRRAAALAALDIPIQYADATFASFELHGPDEDRIKQRRCLTLAQRYVDLWPERQGAHWRDFPHIAIWRGGTGSGKDHLAWSIARAVAVEHGARVVFSELSDTIRDLREAWTQRRGTGPSEAERLDRYRKADLLIIGEVSRHAFHGEATQHLYDVVAFREKWLRPTILTTNDSIDEVSASVGPAIESRAAGWSGVWDFGKSDYREARKRARTERKEGR